MKTTMILAALAGLLSLSSLAAQDPHQGPSDQADLHHGLFPPDVIMRYREQIALTDRQVEDIHTHAHTAQAAFQSKHAALGKKSDALHELLKSPPVDEEAALQQLDGLLEAEKEMKRLQLRLMVRLFNLLNDEQRRKLAHLHRQDVMKGREQAHKDLSQHLHAKLRQVQEGLARFPNAPQSEQTRKLLEAVHENLSLGKPDQANKLLDQALHLLHQAQEK